MLPASKRQTRKSSHPSRKKNKAPARKPNQLLQQIHTVFSKYHYLFLRFATPYLKQRVPLEMLYDYCLNYAIKSAPQFDPTRGTAFATWITNGWKNAMRMAQRSFLRERARFRQISDKRTQKGETSLCWSNIPSQEMKPDELLCLFEQRQRLHHAIAQLNPIEQRVIRARYGIGNIEPSTLKKIGSQSGISKERIRQIQKKAEAKLKQLLKNE